MIFVAAALATPFTDAVPIELPTDPTGKRLLEMYGAMFVTTATPPPVVRFVDQAAIEAFHAGLGIGIVRHADTDYQLQAQAAQALQKAIDEMVGQEIAFELHAESATARTYEQARTYWRAITFPSLDWHVERGTLEAAEAERIRGLPDPAQIDAIVALEAKGIWFDSGHNRSVLMYVAAPGSSQHHSLLAVDIRRPSKDVVRVMEKHHFYRTVRGDRDHFTFLGRSRADLAKVGVVPIPGWYHYWQVELP